jgi:hypothetical protein
VSGARRRLLRKDVFEQRAVPTRFVVRTVAQRKGRAEPVPRPAAASPTTEELESHHVQVSVEVTAGFGGCRPTTHDRAFDVDFDLGVARATLGELQTETGAILAVDEIENAAVSDDESLIRFGKRYDEPLAALIDLPVGEVARSGGGNY